MDSPLVNEEVVTQQLPMSSEVRGSVTWYLGIEGTLTMRMHTPAEDPSGIVGNSQEGAENQEWLNNTSCTRRGKMVLANNRLGATKSLILGRNIRGVARYCLSRKGAVTTERQHGFPQNGPIPSQ